MNRKALLLVAVASITPAGTALALDPAVVETCRSCHKDAASLEGRKPEDLSAAIEAIAQGKVRHAVPMPQLSPEDRKALAEALARKSK